jgi:phage tail protein X
MKTDVLEHITADGERWDLIAYDYYGDCNEESLQRVITANPEVPFYPVFPAGIRLLIPLIDENETASAAGLPPWKG